MDQLLKDIEKAPKKKGKNIYWMHTIPFWSGAVQEALAFNENAQIAGCELSRTFEPDFDPEDPYDANGEKNGLSWIKWKCGKKN